MSALRIAVIGAGVMGGHHARKVHARAQRGGVTLVGVCDTQLDRARNARQFEDLLDRDQPLALYEWEPAVEAEGVRAILKPWAANEIAVRPNAYGAQPHFLDEGAFCGALGAAALGNDEAHP